VIVVRINKKDKSSDSGKEALWEKGRKVCMYLGGWGWKELAEFF
jgi:hypothetical protein